MPNSVRNVEISETLAVSIRSYIESHGHPGESAVKPGDRIPFHWPPHPISYNYHILPSDWRGSIRVDLHGEDFEVLLAQTSFGVFGRCTALWAEAKGADADEMVRNLQKVVAPLFQRQSVIAETLGFERRYKDSIKDLPEDALLKLLYCSDRDVANDARIHLETRPNKVNLLPALLEIIRDERHPHRRSAQWCVLDLLEDMPTFCLDESDEIRAIAAIQDLIRTAPDDYARTIYKAGVVLGGHVPDQHGGRALIELLEAPSKFGRRSAVHGLFHVVEWHPESREEVVRALQKVALHDPEPSLREFADLMAQDIASEQVDHIPEPVFDDESA